MKALMIRFAAGLALACAVSGEGQAQVPVTTAPTTVMPTAPAPPTVYAPPYTLVFTLPGNPAAPAWNVAAVDVQGGTAIPGSNQIQPMAVTRYADGMSAALQQAAAQKQVFPTIIMTKYLNGKPYMQFTLTNSYLMAFRSYYNAQNAGMNQFTLVFQGIRYINL